VVLITPRLQDPTSHQSVETGGEDVAGNAKVAIGVSTEDLLDPLLG
jgi:hypothetical protein